MSRPLRIAADPGEYRPDDAPEGTFWVRPMRADFEKYAHVVFAWREPVCDLRERMMVIGDGVTPLSKLPRIHLPVTPDERDEWKNRDPTKIKWTTRDPDENGPGVGEYRG